jgi:hypothetical protein
VSFAGGNMPDEKFDEKEQEKSDEKSSEEKTSEEKSSEEKSSEEKNWDEKYRRDPLSSLVWACILIWAGLVFLAYNLGWFNFQTLSGLLRGFNLDPWSVILVGAGVIILIGVAIRLLIPEYRRPITVSIFLAAILIGIGLGNIFNWVATGGIILITLGLLIIFRGFRSEHRE